MNRNAEYEQLLTELDALTAPGDGLERALRRERRHRYLVRPLTGIAAAFALFVILVNASTTVAYACSRVPGLRELAAAVSFSRSLSDAVDNEYVQPVNLSETNGDITVRVEYLIVDQKNVTVFYRFLSEKYPRLEADPRVLTADGSAPAPCSYGPNEWDVPNGELRSTTIDFVEEDVPPALRLRLRLRDMGAEEEAPKPPDADIWDDPPQAEFSYVAEFEFLLEFDPYFTAQGKHFTGGQSFTLDGQTLYVDRIDVYPSYLNLTLRGGETNSAWLESLKFYLVTDRGERFDKVANGIVAVRNPEDPGTISFRADSTFFYDAEAVTICMTGAEWLDKGAEKIHVDLKHARADFMPEGTELASTKREGDRWVVTVLQGRADAQVFMQDYYDAAGNRYEYHSWTSGASSDHGVTAPEGFSYDSFPLNDYPYDEVWLTPRYTSRWTADVPVEVTISLK